MLKGELQCSRRGTFFVGYWEKSSNFRYHIVESINTSNLNGTKYIYFDIHYLIYINVPLIFHIHIPNIIHIDIPYTDHMNIL